MTDALTSFLASWLDWATTGAPDLQPYNRGIGLCGECADPDAWAELKELLCSDFGTATYPFCDRLEYLRRAREDTQHELPARLDWVRKQLAKVEKHRGWVIGDSWYGYEATHPDYDPTPVYADDGPSDNRVVVATTRAGLIVEIDNWIADQ